MRYGASLRLSKFAPGKFVEPVGSHPRHHLQKSKTPHEGAFCFSGGEGGIRTHGTLTRTPDFECAIRATATPWMARLSTPQFTRNSLITLY